MGGRNIPTIKERFSEEEWKILLQIDPETAQYLAAAPWQDPDNFASLSTTVTETANIFPAVLGSEAKPSDINERSLEQLGWKFYKTFGPLNASINSKSDYTAQGWSIYSDVYEIDLFLKNLFYADGNDLYSTGTAWIIRMLAEAKLFLLVAFDEEGNASIRSLEPDRIGSGSDSGLLTDPDDVTQTIFYQYYKGTSGFELIPDIKFVLNPDYMKERTKALGDKVDLNKINPLTKGKGSKFNKIGGYRRFIIYWKNLTGIKEILRDTSSLSSVFEWINLYVKAIKWGVDHKRALSAYAWAFVFTDSPAGKVAWHIWNKMTTAEKDATGLAKPFSPGSRIMLLPGLDVKALSPQIPSLSGSNQDLSNLAGSGARTPQDLWEGQSAGATYASMRITRHPLVAEIEGLQSKLFHFTKYKILRPCFAAKLAMGGTVMDAAGKKFKLPETYQDEWPTSKIDKNGNIEVKAKKINKELCEAVKFSFPSVKLDDRPMDMANAGLGSKHAGAQSLGVSDETVAEKFFGIDDLPRERMKRMLEEQKFGKPVDGTQAEKQAEQKFKDKGVEGTGNE